MSYKKIELDAPNAENLSLQEIAQYSLRKYLNKRLTTDRIFLKRQSVCVKAFNENSLYPEVKERDTANPSDVYVLAIVNRKEKVVYLEGWCTKDDLLNDKNKSKDTFYLSYKDLRDLNELNQS